MDTYYRHYHLAFGKSLTVGNDHLDDLFKQVTDKVEGLYTHWFLGELGNNWSDACADELAQYGRILEVPQQVDFYKQKVKNEDNRVFVIISDAFRYEVAASLAEQLRRETQSKVSLGSCAGIFPTITKFGMAALLPHKQLSINERSNGDLQILADGMSTDAGNRDKVLKATNSNSVALKYKDIAPMKRAERSALVKGMDVVYIYHDKVDEASHTSDSMVFSACDDAIEEIKNIVRIIRNEFSGTRVYITADHGFLYTYSPLSEDAKVDKTTPSEQDVEIGSISTTTKDYIINYQDLQGIGMTGKLALPTLIAMCSIALGKPTLSSLAVLGEISISGTMMKVDELANSLQVCLDSGAKRVLLPITSAAELGTVPADLIGSFNLIFYSSAEDAVFKALGVE